MKFFIVLALLGSAAVYAEDDSSFSSEETFEAGVEGDDGAFPSPAARQACADAPASITGGFKCSWGSSGTSKWAKYCCDNGASATINCNNGVWQPLPSCSGSGSSSLPGACPAVRQTIPGGFKCSWGSGKATYCCHFGDKYDITCTNGVWTKYPTCKGFENSPCSDESVPSAPYSTTRKGPQCSGTGPFPSSRCLGDSSALQALYPVSITEAVNRHNCYRKAVNPAAKNMAMVQWNEDLAITAERWAAQCKFEHDANTARAMKGPANWPGVGQNIYYAGFNGSIANAIDSWADERADFKYGTGSTNGGVVGHYTQVVWDTTTHIGCGIAQCSSLAGASGKGPFYFMVCNYGPAGNYNLKTPYASA